MTKNGTSSKIQVEGNLTKDANFQDATEQRSEYAVFDIAITEVVNGKDISRFYTAFVPHVPDGAKPYLVKGSKVWVFGDYSDNIETNPNTKEQYVKRKIQVKDWELKRSKKQSEEETDEQEND